MQLKHHFQSMAPPAWLVLAFAMIVLLTAGAQTAFGQEEGQVQELHGRVEIDGGHLYSIPDLKQGDVLFVYAEGISGNLDPFVVVADTTIDRDKLGRIYREEVEQVISSGADPLRALPEIFDDLFLAWDDDSGVGYAASLSLEIPVDGDYQLLVTSTQAQQTAGGYRLLVGINEPEVLSGMADPTGDEIAILDTSASRIGVAVQEVTGFIDIENRSASHNLVDIDFGDTLYVFIEATSGALKPTIFLEDFGRKPVRSGNFTGEQSEATLEYTFDGDGDGYRLEVSGGEDVSVSNGEYRLLLGMNDPSVLTGKANSAGRSLIKEPIKAEVGLSLEQITGVDQKAENFGIVGTYQMDWQDPELAFSPDSCECEFKVFSGDQFTQFALENQIRWPEFTLFNQQGNRWTQNLLVVVHPDGNASYLERFSATLQAPDFDFTTYPFDTQQFFIRVVSAYPEEFILFSDVEGNSKLGDQLGEEEWIITEYGTEIETVNDRSRYSFGFQAERHLIFYFLRIFIPILIIIIVSWTTFFLKDYGKRVDVVGANLLLFIAFNFTISDDLPRLGYLTFLDTVLTSTFIVTGLVLIFNVGLKRLEITGRSELASRLDKYTVFLYPFAYVGAIIGVTFFFT